jgi:predicted small secreted protein
MKRTIWAGLLASTLALASVSAFAQTAGQDIKDAGHETKQAAKNTGKGIKKGTKTAYRKTKNGTKTAVHKTGEGAEKLGDKMEGKPKPQQ